MISTQCSRAGVSWPLQQHHCKGADGSPPTMASAPLGGSGGARGTQTCWSKGVRGRMAPPPMHNCTYIHICACTIAPMHARTCACRQPEVTCTHTCTNIHARVHVHVHIGTHVSVRTRARTRTLRHRHAAVYVHACACTHLCVFTHPHACMDTHAYILMNAPRRGHRHTHARTHKHLCTLTHTQGHGHIDIHTPTHPHACPRMHGDIDIHVYLCMLTHARTRTLMHAYTDAAAGNPIPVPSPAVPPPAAPAQPHAAAATCRRPETWGALAAPAHQQPHCSRAVLCGRTRGRATRDRGTRCRRGCQQSPAAENTSLSWRAKPQNPPSLAPPFKQPQEQCHLPKLPLALAAPALLWHPSVKAGRAPGCRLNNTPYK